MFHQLDEPCILFTHYSVDKNLDCFPSYWIILLQTSVSKFLCRHMFSFLLRIYLGLELLGHMVTLCLIITETAILFSKTSDPSKFPPTHPANACYQTFCSRHPTGCSVVSRALIYLSLSSIMLSIFHEIIAHLQTFLGEITFAHFKTWFISLCV